MLGIQDTIPMAKAKQPQPKNFEDAMTELESLLTDMEHGEIPLEESLAKYERGNFLIQYCRGVLDTAQKQIESMGTTKSAPVELEGTEEDED